MTAADDGAPAVLGRPPTMFERAFYRFVRWVLVRFSRAFWALTVSGQEHIPSTGPFILAPVHRSNVDTPIVCAVTKRRLRYMGKHGVWKYRWSAWFFTTLGGFPVHRGTTDRGALRNCVAVIEAGEPLVMFPEGTRQSGPVMGTLFDGPAYVASRTGAPIVPLGIGGSERAQPRGSRIIRPARLHLEIGPPIHPEGSPGERVPRSAVRRLSEQLRVELQRLFDVAQEKVGAPTP